MKTEIAFVASSTPIHFAWDGRVMVMILPEVVPKPGVKGLAVELAPHEFTELADALAGLAESIRPDANRHYQARLCEETMRHTLKHAKELGKEIQEGADPDAGEAWRDSLKPRPGDKR